MAPSPLRRDCRPGAGAPYIWDCEASRGWSRISMREVPIRAHVPQNPYHLLGSFRMHARNTRQFMKAF